MVKESPYKETLMSHGEIDTVVRTFTGSLDEEDLKWHWDEEDRVIHPIHETDWMFQFDNELPQRISTEIKVKKGVWHRLIKGTGNLQLVVEKIKDI